MAVSSCVRCQNRRFEVKVGEPSNARYRVLYIQCTSCGGVAGVTDYVNTAVQISNLEEAVKKITRRLGL